MSFDTIRTEQPLSVEDHIAILNLYARYNHLLDSLDYTAWTECFTEDGEFDVPYGGVVYRGRAELREFAERYMIRTEGHERHITTSIELLRGEDDEVHGRAYLLMIVGGKPKDPPKPVSSARYEDLVRRTPSGWRFARRVVNSDAF